MTINSDASTAPAPATGLIHSRVNSPQTSMEQKASSKSIDAITRRHEATKVELGEQSAKLLSSQEKSVEHLNGLDAQLAEAIKTLNDSLSRTPTKANISHDDVLNRFIVRIADKESGDIVREIPSEDLLNFARHLERLKGILFDKKV